MLDPSRGLTSPGDRSSSGGPGPGSAPQQTTGLGASVGYMGGANGLAFGAGIVRQKLFAVFLGPSSFGVYSVAASLTELLTTLCSLGASTGLLRQMSASIMQGRRSEAAWVMIVVRRVLMVTSVVVVVAVAAAASRISELLGGAIPPWGIAVSAAAVPFILMSGLADAALNSLGRIGRLAASKTATTVISLAAMAPLVIFFGLAGGLVQLFTGALIGYAVSHMALRPYFNARRWAAEAPVDSGELRRLALGAFAVGLAQMSVHAAVTGNLFVFRSLILVELGSLENGLYQGVMGLSRQYLGAVASGVFVYAYPVLSGLAQRPAEFQEELDRALRFVLTISVPAALVLLGVRDWIVRLVFTDEFLGMVPLMAWSLSTDVVALVFGVLRIALLASGRARLFGTLGVAVELVYLAVFFFALRAWGLDGAVAAYLISSALGVVTFSAALWNKGLLGGRRGSLATTGLAAVLVAAAATVDLTPASRLIMVGTAAGWSWFFRDTLRRAFTK